MRKPSSARKPQKTSSTKPKATPQKSVPPKAPPAPVGKGIAAGKGAQPALPLSLPDETGVKARRTRVPKNFAEQYGGAAQAQARKTPAAPAPKSRKTTKQRQAEQKLRADLMAPSDDIVARLARMGTITGTVLGDDSEEDHDDSPSGGKKRASHGWEHQCGKCGTVGKFRKSVGVCPTCGAIAVRE